MDGDFGNPCWGGVDEVGRGPLAGPVVAVALWLPLDHGIVGLRDSKQLSAETRARLAPQIRSAALSLAMASVSSGEIDQMNIHVATLLAMRLAVTALVPRPPGIWVDGCFVPSLEIPAEARIRADARYEAVSAASIVAKEYRDRLMARCDRLYPGYGFSRHKGYPTQQHLDALDQLGPCPLHRTTFAPVRERLART
jgi:ribonuclease HII